MKSTEELYMCNSSSDRHCECGWEVHPSVCAPTRRSQEARTWTADASSSYQAQHGRKTKEASVEEGADRQTVAPSGRLQRASLIQATA